MAKITFYEFNGTEHQVEGEAGMSVMETAIHNGVPGIDADCGGQCSCATCHVIVDDAWLGKMPPMSDQEDSMLDLNPERQENSRLSCQIPVSEEVDGLVVQLPEFQG